MFTCFEAFTGLPFQRTLPASQASAAIERVLNTRIDHRYLSILNFSAFFSMCTILYETTRLKTGRSDTHPATWCICKNSGQRPVDRLLTLLRQQLVGTAIRFAAKETVVRREGRGVRRLQYKVFVFVDQYLFLLGKPAP